MSLGAPGGWGGARDGAWLGEPQTPPPFKQFSKNSPEHSAQSTAQSTVHRAQPELRLHADAQKRGGG